MRSKTLVFLLAVGLLLGRSAFGTEQLLINGPFTNSVPSTGWAILPESTTFAGINFEPGFLAMGDIPGPQNLLVYQQVNIPANVLYAQLQFSLTGSSPDPMGVAGFAPLVVDASGIDVLTNLGTVVNNGSFAQTEGPFNVSAFIGKTVDITFDVDLGTNVLDSSTLFKINQVSLLGYTTNDIPANDDFSNSITLVTPDIVIATNVVATLEPGEPPKIAGVTGGHSVWWNWTPPSDGVATINTKGSTCRTLLGVYTGDSVSNLTQVAANNGGGTDSQVSFPAAVGTKYQIAVDGANGAVGVVELNLLFAQTSPTVTIKSPASKAKLTNSTVLVEGTASDKVAVGAVQVQLINANGTNAFQTATGTNTWSVTINNLTPGTNIINAIAYDTSGNASKIASEMVTYIVVSPLTLTINGTGTVSPDLTNKDLDLNTSYTLTAKPGRGQIFSNWTDADGVQLATTAAFTFPMTSNLMLIANFTTNPFIPFLGDYQGLFYDTNGPEHASSGFFNVTLASSGSFTAKGFIGGVSASFTGQFSAAGFASNSVVVHKGSPPVSVQWQLDLNSGGITGLLSNGVWMAEFNAELPSATPPIGHYTLDIPGEGTEVNPTNAGVPIIDQFLPGVGGDSYATVTVSSKGVSLSGELADGTKISQGANVLANNQWPFYVSLYSGNGSIFGWLTFSNQVDSDITGTVNWFKLPQAAKFYPGGITNITDVTGSIYLFTNGVPVLNWPGGNGIATFIFNENSLPPGFGDPISLSSANKITSTNALTASITTSSGLFKVTATDPNTGKAVTGNGVVLQKQSIGIGFFPGTNQTAGLILLAPPN